MSNTRTITAIIAFVAAFIFSAGLVRLIFPAPVAEFGVVTRQRYVTPQYTNPQAAAIEEFINQDELNGTSREYSQRSYADSVMNYWKMSSSMDASNFPQDFQNAWRVHMAAWGNYAEYLQDAKRSKSRSSQMEAKYNAEINRTWEEVLSIGRDYGANVY